jgi:hypothetical protein
MNRFIGFSSSSSEFNKLNPGLAQPSHSLDSRRLYGVRWSVDVMPITLKDDLHHQSAWQPFALGAVSDALGKVAGGKAF